MSSTDRQNRLLVAEDWKRIYQTYRNADFKSYDFENLRRTMINYQLYVSFDGSQSVTKTVTGSNHVLSIPFDPDNTDYQEYLEWVAEGNTPDPAE